jgi:hypothetical protein
LVQAFINLTPERKSARFKGPIAESFGRIAFPYIEKK